MVVLGKWHVFVLFFCVMCCLIVYSTLAATLSQTSSVVVVNRDRDVQEDVKVPTQMLVVVIAGGNKDPYPVLRTFWRMIAKEVSEMGIVVYLVNFDASIKVRTTKTRKTTNDEKFGLFLKQSKQNKT
jgi:hypothetical protein